MNSQWEQDDYGEEEMHTAPHPTLGEIQASLLGSKGLFKQPEQRYMEQDSMAPWVCPVPTSAASWRGMRAWRSVCSSPQSVLSLPFSFPSGRTSVVKRELSPTLVQSQRRLCCRSKASQPSSATIPKAKPPPLRRKGSTGTNTHTKDLRRPPIQLRASHLRVLAVQQRVEKPPDLCAISVDVSHNKTLSRISDRTMSASTFAESYRGSFIGQKKAV